MDAEGAWNTMLIESQLQPVSAALGASTHEAKSVSNETAVAGLRLFVCTPEAPNQSAAVGEAKARVITCIQRRFGIGVLKLSTSGHSTKAAGTNSRPSTWWYFEAPMPNKPGKRPFCVIVSKDTYTGKTGMLRDNGHLFGII